MHESVASASAAGTERRRLPPFIERAPIFQNLPFYTARVPSENAKDKRNDRCVSCPSTFGQIMIYLIYPQIDSLVPHLPL